MQAGRGRYIPRAVDTALLDLCRSGTFAFVLSARQMGKSSLMVRTAEKLAEGGIRSLIIDLSQIGVHVTPDAWYSSLLTRIEDSLLLETDTYEWWQSRTHLSYGQRLTQFFEKVLLEEVGESLVVFIDEIDSTLTLPFTDDFFAAIRYTYNARSRVPAFKRLSFVLIGVAAPNDLISDPRRTPFNIGTEVDVNYFTPDEASLLSAGFDLSPEKARDVINWILKWTGGHPYLTQLLCATVAERPLHEVSQKFVDRVVEETFFGKRSQKDTNLRFVNDMLTRWAPDQTAVLTTYRRVLRGRRVEDDRQSPIVSHLKLSGVVARRNGRLRVSTRIYATVFDLGWVRKQWPEHWIRRVPPVVIGLLAALFAATILLALFVLQTQRTSQAQEQSELQRRLNQQLSAQIEVSDSLRVVSEAANMDLSDQARISDSLRLGTEAVNYQLSAQIGVSDSLRRVTEASSVRILDQASISDSLRGTAVRRLAEIQIARLETITIALADKARRQLRLGDPQLAALLARQAFLFNEAGNGDFVDPVYDVMVQTLNALETPDATVRGGPDVIDGFEGGVRSVAYSPDGRRLASGNEDGSIALIDTNTGAMKRFRGHLASVRTLAFSQDGALLASGSDDRTLLVWRNLEQEEPTRTRIGEHHGSIWTVAFTPDAQHLASAGEDGTVMIWRLSRPSGPAGATLSIDARVRSLVFVSEGKTLVLGSDTGDLSIWNWQEPGSEPTTWSSGQRRVNDLAFHPTSGLLAVGGDRPPVRLWRLSRHSAVPELERDLAGHEGPVNSVAFNADGTLLASGSADRSVQLWDVNHFDRNPILLKDHTAWVWSVAFSPDGRRLASGGADTSIRIWNIQPQILAANICEGVAGRELSRTEWSQFVGDDFLYREHYQPCSLTADVIEITGGD